MKDKTKQLIIKLSQSDLDVNEQFKVFNEKTNKSRKTFFRYRKELKLNKDYKPNPKEEEYNSGNYKLNITYHYLDKKTNEWKKTNSYNEYYSKK